MQPARSHRDLKVYKAAFALQQEAFGQTKGFPRDERFALVTQVRRSSRSIGANVAEAWQKRRYRGHFVSKLTAADAEPAETKHWVDTAAACGYLSPDHQARLREQCESVGGMLGRMLAAPSRWCS